MIGKLKVVMVVAKDGFRDEELFDAKAEFESNDIKVFVASTEEGTATSKFGKEQKIDLTLDEIDPADFNAVVFVGGPGMHAHLKDPKMMDVANTFFQKGLVTAGICVAPAILANAGILKGKRATAHSDAEEAVKNAGAEWTGEPIESDGIIVTANGPDAAKAFAEVIAQKIRC